MMDITINSDVKIFIFDNRLKSINICEKHIVTKMGEKNKKYFKTLPKPIMTLFKNVATVAETNNNELMKKNI